MGKVWPITYDVTTDGRVVSLRHAKLNEKLVPLRAAGQVFARVLEVSVVTRTGLILSSGSGWWPTGECILSAFEKTI